MITVALEIHYIEYNTFLEMNNSCKSILKYHIYTYNKK